MIPFKTSLSHLSPTSLFWKLLGTDSRVSLRTLISITLEEIPRWINKERYEINIKILCNSKSFVPKKFQYFYSWYSKKKKKKKNNMSITLLKEKTISPTLIKTIKSNRSFILLFINSTNCYRIRRLAETFSYLERFDWPLENR